MNWHSQGSIYGAAAMIHFLDTEEGKVIARKNLGTVGIKGIAITALGYGKLDKRMKALGTGAQLYYMRNIGVLGICLYFIFRWNDIFASRLIANFLIYMPMVLVNIVAAVSSDRLRKSLQYVLLMFMAFQYFVYANQHGLRTGYTMEYRNILWIE